MNKFKLLDKTKIYLIAIFFLSISMGVGYAYLSSSLGINGFIQIKKDRTLYNLMKRNSTLDTDVNFNASVHNGIYELNSTKDDEYPVYYYRGNVTNNNVKFAGYCWKIVRTTSTGGIKLFAYNKIDDDGKCNVARNNVLITDNAYNSDINSPSDIGYMYGKRYNITYTSPSSFLKDWPERVGKSVNSSSSLSAYKHGTGIYENGLYKITNQSNTFTEGQYISPCAGYGESGIEYHDTCTYAYYVTNVSGNSVSYISVSNGELGENLKAQGQLKFGNDVEYINGSYKLKGDIFSNEKNMSYTGDFNQIANKYHYTCLSSSDTCSNIYYAVFINSSSISYITLSDGETIETAKENMFSNTTDSKAKVKLDKWYKENLEDYTNKLEDTIWCNDRSLSTTANSSMFNSKDSGTASFYSIYFSSYDRNLNPTIECKNKNDRFTVDSKNGNGALEYPIGLLTADELILAGNAYHTQYSYLDSSSTFNTYTNNIKTMTPYSIVTASTPAMSLVMKSNSQLIGKSDLNISSDYFLFPSISLKPGTKYVSGDGSIDNPYIVE